MKLLFAVAATAAFVSSVVHAQTERDLDSHEHGSASMNVAIDDDVVVIELESPWDNLVGFEHTPKTDEQIAMVDAALDTLVQANQLFAFKGTQCALTDAMIENGLAMADDEHHDDEHADEHEHHDDEHHDEKHADGHEHHDDEKHADSHEHHDDEHHDDEKHADAHEHHDEKHADAHEHHDDEHAHDHSGETHASIFVGYTFECEDIPSLTGIDVTLLNVWDGFEELDVQLIGPGGQALLELTPQQTLADVSQVQ